MDMTKIDFIMNVFKTLSTDVPDQMLFRDNGECIELKTPDSIGTCLPLDLQDNGWRLVGCRIGEAA
ncbi:MAG: hypothetical protein IJH90_08205 [Mogibacterium sp.]|nr:hypothetical protein [Mogibacterium sp.]